MLLHLFFNNFKMGKIINNEILTIWFFSLLFLSLSLLISFIMALDSLQAPACNNYRTVKVKWKWYFSSSFEISILHW